MSGTSLDGIDAVLAEINSVGKTRLIQSHSLVFEPSLKHEFLALQSETQNELHREHLAANALAKAYAQACEQLLEIQGIDASQICAIGAHGQTLRHQPHSSPYISYTHQSLNPALLAEITGIDVIANFRLRDMAAGGQGAPLVPAFHQQQFFSASENRAVLNIGGIANLTLLAKNEGVRGFDCGPGNLLLDAWIQKNDGQDFDHDGQWARTGIPNPELLAKMRSDPYFAQQPPKSTGRDHFNLNWISGHLEGLSVAPEDVQASLLQLTIDSIITALKTYAHTTQTLIVCGGGIKNIALMELLKIQARTQLPNLKIESSAQFGVDPQLVESLAFAWLAWAYLQKRPANVPAVTGAKGLRILGAHYPAH
jgi:anhydro-N-acetylmuramic acid kinase